MSTAYVTLQQALDDLAEQGQHPPCQGPDADLWVSDHAGDRAEAATRCAPCPLVAECLAAAEQAKEQAGVWGGVPFGKPTRGAVSVREAA